MSEDEFCGGFAGESLESLGFDLEKAELVQPQSNCDQMQDRCNPDIPRGWGILTKGSS